MILIETARLFLRNVAAKDAETIYDYRNNGICAMYQRGQIKDLDGIEDLVDHHKDDEIFVDADLSIDGTDWFATWALPTMGFISFTEPENKPSMALLKKLGYKDMGYLPDMESQVFGKLTTPATELEIGQAINNKDNPNYY